MKPGTALVLSLALLAGCRPVTLPAPSTGAAPSPNGRVASRPAVDSTEYTIGEFEGCPPAGIGGDPDLNRLKNRDREPPAYEPMGLEELLSSRPEAALDAGRALRARWPRAALRAVAPWERRGVAVEAYLHSVRQMGPESCNCGRKDRRDYHVWLVPRPEAEREEALIAEVSPRLLPAHPGWRLRILSRLAKNRPRVRVSGWLMWDGEHPEYLGRTRGTLWEIHPIHRIEVFSGGRWREL